jgi:HSP20 family molecular chaperone IbpA
MWAEALDLLQGAEPPQRRFFTVEAVQSVPCWEPAVDLYDDGEEFTLLIALPGVSSGQCEVVLDEAGVLVYGQRPIPPVLHRAAIHRLEIPYGRFERRISLPPGDYRLHQQFFEDGCLVLVLRHVR